MDASRDRRRVARARDEFLTSGSVPEGAVRDPILSSWCRSRQAGVAADLSHLPYEEVDLQGRLARCAGPVLRRLEEELADTSVSIVLTDAQGRLLDRRDGDRRVRRHLDKVLFAAGFSYAEGYVGTNGVGTALAEGRAVYVHGPEHFNELIQSFACAGVPIRNPLTGRIEGLVDLSCLADDANPIMRVLAQEAARDIERQLLEGGSERERVMLEEFLAACRNGQRAVMAVSGDVVMTDQRAAGLLSSCDQAILRAKVDELRTVAPEGPVELSLSDGRWAQVRYRCVSVADEVAGVLMQINVRNRPDAAGAAAPATARRIPAVRLPGLAGGSAAWMAACTQVREAARRCSPLLLIGEEGTGKLALARSAHQDRHPGARCIVIDAGDDPRRRADDLQAAHEHSGATVILRRLERLDPESADHLVGELRRLATVAPPLWLIGTLSTSETSAEVTDALLGCFTVSVTVPALRHRIEDLHQIVSVLLERLAPRRHVTCTPDAMRTLVGYLWPGNVSQLEQVLRAALARRPAGDIEADHLPAECHSSSRRVLTTLETVERDAIVAALRRVAGNRAQAATVLGISRSSLYRKMHTYGIDDGVANPGGSAVLR